MEKTAAIGNSSNLYRFIRNTDPWKPRVSEMDKKSGGTLIHFQGHWQWPKATVGFPLMPASAGGYQSSFRNANQGDRSF